MQKELVFIIDYYEVLFLLVFLFFLFLILSLFFLSLLFVPFLQHFPFFVLHCRFILDSLLFSFYPSQIFDEMHGYEMLGKHCNIDDATRA